MGDGAADRKLILVHHSHTQVDPNVTAAEWHLSDGGRARCAQLAERLRLYDIETLVASPEFKAIETAELVAGRLGLRPEIANGLQEHDRSNLPFYDSQDEFQLVVKRLFEKPDESVVGRETAVEARSRFTKALNKIIEDHPSGNIAIVTHGTVMSLYIGHETDVDAYRFWTRLGMPSFTVLSLPDLRLLETVESNE